MTARRELWDQSPRNFVSRGFRFLFLTLTLIDDKVTDESHEFQRVEPTANPGVCMRGPFLAVGPSLLSPRVQKECLLVYQHDMHCSVCLVCVLFRGTSSQHERVDECDNVLSKQTTNGTYDTVDMKQTIKIRIKDGSVTEVFNSSTPLRTPLVSGARGRTQNPYTSIAHHTSRETYACVGRNSSHRNRRQANWIVGLQQECTFHNIMNMKED